MKINLSNRSQSNSPSAISLANEIAETYMLSKKTAELIVARGVTSVKEAGAFMCFSEKDLLNPYDLSSMSEVIDKLKLSVANGEKIVVFGDYDADGICASYILVKALREIGGDVTPYIPNRSEGYGLNVSAVDEIVEKYAPNLILTCDLGISCHAEVEYIKSLGIDVIVTDHHELPELLPDCLTINPKLDVGRYECVELCGAGVAFKIAQALVPFKFHEYEEFAAIATVADSVPLKGENRIIVKLGLDKMKTNPSFSLKILMELCGIKGDITSTTIAFVLAPRINASGRMGVALRSLDMFLSENEKDIRSLVEDINRDNILRQKGCEEIFNQGYRQFIKTSDRYACILENEEWQSGLLGIVASKLSEEFSRPTILFSHGDGTLRGSGRSIDGINMYKMLSSMSDLFITFGGHAQACGLTIAKENFEEFQNRVEQYLKDNIQLENFLIPTYYDIEDDIVPTKKMIDELAVFEPYGIGNPKPIFLRVEKSLNVELMKNYPQHVVGCGENSELLAFSQGKYIDVLRSPYKKALLVDYSLNEFRGKTTIKGSIKTFFTMFDSDNVVNQSGLSAYLFAMKVGKLGSIDIEEYIKLTEKSKFGVLTLVNTEQGLEFLKNNVNLNDFLVEANAVVAKSNMNRILISPKSSLNFEKFHTIVVVENNIPNYIMPADFNGKILSLGNNEYMQNVNLKQDRAVFGKIFIALRTLHMARLLTYKKIQSIMDNLGIDIIDGMYAIACFRELGLITVEDGTLEVTENKTELTNSTLYNLLEK